MGWDGMGWDDVALMLTGCGGGLVLFSLGCVGLVVCSVGWPID